MKAHRKLIIIGCARSAGVAMEQLWQSGWELPAGVEWVSMSCGSAIDELHITRAFEAGAENVLILSCFEGACRSLEGSRWVSRRVKAVHRLLQEVGISPERLVHQNISPNMGADLRTWIEQLVAPQPPAAQNVNEA